MAGRIAYYGNLIANKPILCLDAAKKDSYPGSGTAWYDISGNNNHFTLYNGVGFNSDKGGYLAFDGVNDYAVSNNNINLSSYDYIVVEIFYICNNTTAQTMIYEHTNNWNSNNGGFGLALNSNGGSNLANYNHTNHKSEAAKNYAVVDNLSWSNNLNIHSKITDSTGRLTYLNSTLTPFTTVGGYSTSTLTVSSGGVFANDKFYIGSRGGVSIFFNGNISSIKIYGIKLDSTQVTQNYNALKGRYGL